MSVTTGVPRSGSDTDRSRAPGTRHWPLTVLLLGYPLWWVLGVDSFLPMVLAVPMALQLARLPRVVVPTGFGWWMLFLAWVLLGIALLGADAPGAVPGGDSSRLLVYAFRLGWYAACTVVLLWVTNLDRKAVPDRLVLRLVGWMFVVTVAGGLLGVLAPTVEFRSAFELLLPQGLGGNELVQSLVHPQVADVQEVLGRPEPRPKAPFPFSNTWGSVLSLSLVFLLAAGLRGPWLRGGALVLFPLAAIPIAYSLNRGLWVSLAVGLVGVLALRVLRGDRRASRALVAAAAIGAVAFLASPLGDLAGERLDNQHSNDRRTQLLVTTVDSVSTGSPVLGFGSTRDLQGGFSSIAGGATPDCPACGVPPLGTQGQGWLVLFSQGWLGLLSFLAFFLVVGSRTWRCRTPAQTVCTFAIGFFVLQLPIYDTLGIPLYLVMIGIGLAARERLAEVPRHLAPLGIGRARRTVALVAVATVGGAALGALMSQMAQDESYRSTMSVLVARTPVQPDLGAPPDPDDAEDPPPEPTEVTVDTEAALVGSGRALAGAARVSGIPVEELRQSLTVTAAPNSRVMRVSLVARDRTDADLGARAVADAYLRERSAVLLEQRQEALEGLRSELADLDFVSRPLTLARGYLAGRIDHLLAWTPTSGQVFRTAPPEPVARQTEVPVASGAALGLLLGVGLTRAGGRALHRAARPRRGRS